MFKLGFLFHDYQSAGSGISKHAPKKKGMALFLDLLGRKFWRLAGLNLLYFMFFIPLMLILPALAFIPSAGVALIVSALLVLTFMILIGPATAGLTRVLRCYIVEKHAYVTRDFFRGFRGNFKNAAVVGFIDSLVAISAFAAMRVYPLLASQLSVLMYIPLMLTYSLVILIVMMNYYIYLMMDATSLSLKNLIKNSLMLAFVAMKRNVVTTLLIVLIIAALYPLLLFALPFFMTLLPFYPAAFIAFVACFRSYPVIQQYVINPYYASIGQVNPELTGFADPEDEESVFEDKGGEEKPIESRKKGKGKRIS